MTLLACMWPVYRDQIRPQERVWGSVGLPFSYLRDFSDGFEPKSNFGYFPNSFSTLDFSQLEAAGRVCHRRGFLAYKALLAHLDRGMVERWSLSYRI